MPFYVLQRVSGPVLSACIFALFTSSASADTEVCTHDDVRYELLDIAPNISEEGLTGALNELGQTTGFIRMPDGRTHAFLWDCWSGLTDIGATPGSDPSWGFLINNRTTIVGRTFGDASETFIWDRTNGMRIISGDLATSLNDFGDVTLSLEGATFWNEATGFRPLNELGGVNVFMAWVNNRRALAAYGVVPDGTYQPQFVRWSAAGGAERLELPVQGAGAQLKAFNDRGDILVSSLAEEGVQPFILPRDGTPLALVPDFVSGYIEALAFNNRREAIGFVHHESTEDPFIWDPTHGLRDLNVLVFGHPSEGGVRILRPTDINEWGWMAVYIQRAGSSVSHPALVIPVPASSRYFENLSQRSGPALCHAFTLLKLRALATTRACDDSTAP